MTANTIWFSENYYYKQLAKIACEAHSVSMTVFVCARAMIWFGDDANMCIACTKFFKWIKSNTINGSHINGKNKQTNKHTWNEWHMSINLWFTDYDRCCFFLLLGCFGVCARILHAKLYFKYRHIYLDFIVFWSAQTMWGIMLKMHATDLMALID